MQDLDVLHYTETVEELKKQFDTYWERLKSNEGLPMKDALNFYYYLLKEEKRGSFRFGGMERFLSIMPVNSQATIMKDLLNKFIIGLGQEIRDASAFPVIKLKPSADAIMRAEVLAAAIKTLVESKLGIGVQRAFSIEKLTTDLTSVDHTFVMNSEEVKRAVDDIVARKLDFSRQGFKIASQPNSTGVFITRTEVGGIDFNPENLKMNVKKDGSGVQFAPISDEAIQGMNINGFVPVIINVVPATNLPFILGIKKEDDKENLAYRS